VTVAEYGAAPIISRTGPTGSALLVSSAGRQPTNSCSYTLSTILKLRDVPAGPSRVASGSSPGAATAP